jgi:hypothetical protein
VAHDVGALDAQVVEHGEHVAEDVGQRVGADVVGPGRVAEAPQVGSDRPQPGRGECRHLVAPQVVRVGPTVQQQHRRPVLGSLDRHLDLDVTAGHAHGDRSLLVSRRR